MGRKTKTFINLTNGIEFIDNIDDIQFIRIPSTFCEKKMWDTLIQTLDSNFLIYLALGYKCKIIDGSNSPPSRALWQGVEFIKFCINRCWFNKPYKPICRNMNVEKYFTEQYNKLSKSTERKLKYFRKFLLCDDIDIETCCFETKKDGCYDFYKEKLNGYV